MEEHTRFGPAGVPPMFRVMGATTSDVPKLLHEEGLDAFEYQASRWGPKPQIKLQDAQKLGEEARKNDVRLSMHGSYFVNLSGKKEVVEASKRRLIACATAADWMGAYVVVFHTGFYGKFEKDYAFKTCLTALKEVIAEIKSLGLEVKLDQKPWEENSKSVHWKKSSQLTKRLKAPNLSSTGGISTPFIKGP
jgi:deoxyribonuclease-4